MSADRSTLRKQCLNCGEPIVRSDRGHLKVDPAGAPSRVPADRFQKHDPDYAIAEKIAVRPPCRSEKG